MFRQKQRQKYRDGAGSISLPKCKQEFLTSFVLLWEIGLCKRKAVQAPYERTSLERFGGHTGGIFGCQRLWRGTSWSFGFFLRSTGQTVLHCSHPWHTFNSHIWGLIKSGLISYFCACKAASLGSWITTRKALNPKNWCQGTPTKQPCHVGLCLSLCIILFAVHSFIAVAVFSKILIICICKPAIHCQAELVGGMRDLKILGKRISSFVHSAAHLGVEGAIWSNSKVWSPQLYPVCIKKLEY